jgi:hypothetical protein
MTRRKVCYLALFVCLVWIGSVQASDKCDNQGAYLPADLNHDCYVNFKDFAMFAHNWLICNDPENTACTFTP